MVAAMTVITSDSTAEMCTRLQIARFYWLLVNALAAYSLYHVEFLCLLLITDSKRQTSPNRHYIIVFCVIVVHI